MNPLRVLVFLFGALVLACVLAGCAGPHLGNPADDFKKMQGTWKLVSCEYDGGPQTGNVEWVVDGDHYFIRIDGQLGNDPYTFKLDASHGRIDVFHHEVPQGPYYGGSLKGIYALNGNSLKVCYDLTDRYYPNLFDASKGSRRVVYEFQRE